MLQRIEIMIDLRNICFSNTVCIDEYCLFTQASTILFKDDDDDDDDDVTMVIIYD